MYFLFMSHQSGALQEHCSGAGIQHFTGQALAKFEMPFPTLDVAETMISTIEEMQRNSTELEAHFQKKLRDLDDLT
jgi:type I restriction enzyme, S subunit